MKHRFTAAEDAAIINGYSRRPLSEIARRLGLHPGSVVTHSHVLEQRGALDIQRRFYSRPWTKKQEERLRGMWGWHDPSVVATKMRRTLNAVVLKAHRIGLSREWKGRYTSGGVGKIFGVDAKIVTHVWMAQGWLDGKQSKTRAAVSWRWEITHEAIEAFIREHPLRYDRCRIKDDYWRKLADDAARHVDTVSVVQAAAILHVGTKTIKRHLQRGWLPGEQVYWAGGWAWRIRREALAGFVLRHEPGLHAKGRRGALPRRAA